MKARSLIIQPIMDDSSVSMFARRRWRDAPEDARDGGKVEPPSHFATHRHAFTVDKAPPDEIGVENPVSSIGQRLNVGIAAEWHLFRPHRRLHSSLGILDTSDDF